jgi:hypothetical protein
MYSLLFGIVARQPGHAFIIRISVVKSNEWNSSSTRMIVDEIIFSMEDQTAFPLRFRRVACASGAPAADESYGITRSRVTR